MDEKQFIKLLKQSNSDHVLNAIENMNEKERRLCSKGAIALYRRVYRFTGGGSGRAADPKVLDFDAPVAGALGTAALEEILALKHLPFPFFSSTSEIYGRLQLPWLQEAVELLLHPEDVSTFEPLWREGLCSTPSTDALVFGYLDGRQSGKLDETVLLEDVVWRLFETVGKKPYFSLPKHDESILYRRSLGFVNEGRGDLWSDRLLGYVRDGKLDRHRILAATILAIGIKRPSAEIKWFIEFYEALKPALNERKANQDLFLSLAELPKSPSSAFGKRQLRLLS